MNATDRCDVGNCGAQAFVRAHFTTGTLDFCRHHGEKYRAALKIQAYEVVDESTKINTKASLSSA